MNEQVLAGLRRLRSEHAERNAASDVLDAAIAALGKVAHAQQPVVSEGWVMVPRELTREMETALSVGMLNEGSMSDLWFNLLAAAPTETQPQGEAVVVETVGFVRASKDGERWIDWTLEGGVAELEDGCELIVSATKLTDNEGSGEVYQHPQAKASEAGQGVDWTKDAEECGRALNEAAWEFIEHCPEKSALLFNNTKAPLRAAILKYASVIATRTQEGRG